MSDTHRTPDGYQIERAMSAWHQMREAMADDPALLTEDAIREAFDEARSPYPMELLERLIDAVWWNGRELDDANQLRAMMIARRDRRQDRDTMLRLLIQQLMTALETKSRRGRYASASLALSSRQSVVITDADALPAEFVRVIREPKLILIGDAMRKDGLAIPGAELSNPGVPVLTIRTV